MKQKWQQLTIAPEKTHHLHGGKPAYPSRFEQVMKFHLPGIAPVQDLSGAYHIDSSGEPIYEERFYQTFGFYEGLAAVKGDKGWFHIDTKGKPLYQERYTWCGNFQEGKCAVCITHHYFHLDAKGKPLYSERYSYAGDFKDGVAVVCLVDGKSRHIDASGRFVHPHKFCQLGIFHKRYACAKDEKGWFHLDEKGVALYPFRFAALEPFYNGQAHAETYAGDLVVIDERGKIIHTIFKALPDDVGQLSGELVGFWKAETLQLALDLGVIAALPGTLDTLESKTEIPQLRLERLLRALCEIGVVEKGKEYFLTQKGSLLKGFMAPAVTMWSEVQQEWKGLRSRFKQEQISHHLTFKEQRDEVELYQKALRGYALEDLQEVAKWEKWGQFKTLLALGQTGITLLFEILKEHPSVKGIVLNRPLPLYQISSHKRVKALYQDPLDPWPVSADAVLLPRFLHYFPEKEALTLLQHAYQTGSKLFIFEMVLDEKSPSGGLLDLNMLAESGGELRTQAKWHELLEKAGFSLERFLTLKPHLHLMEATRRAL